MIGRASIGALLCGGCAGPEPDTFLSWGETSALYNREQRPEDGPAYFGLRMEVEVPEGCVGGNGDLSVSFHAWRAELPTPDDIDQVLVWWDEDGVAATGVVLSLEDEDVDEGEGDLGWEELACGHPSCAAERTLGVDAFGWASWYIDLHVSGGWACTLPAARDETEAEGRLELVLTDPAWP